MHFVKKLTRKFNELFAKNRRINIIFMLKRLKKTTNQLEKIKRIKKNIQDIST